MAVPDLFILRGGCDAGWHHRERHFPCLGFRVRHQLILLFIYVLLEVFVEFFDGECEFVGGYRVEALAATRLYCFGRELCGAFVTSAWRSSASRLRAFGFAAVATSEAGHVNWHP